MLFSLPSIFRFSGMRMHHFLNKTKTFFFKYFHQTTDNVVAEKPSKDKI